MPPQPETVAKARDIAQKITSYDTVELQRELVNEGAYHFVVESGFHKNTVSDDVANILIDIITKNGLEGLEQFAQENTGLE